MGPVSAILSAAGASTRMGRPKPLLPWRGGTLIEFQVRCLLDAGCDEIVAVLGHKADEVSPYVRGQSAHVAVNPDYAKGKTTSIKAGLLAIEPGASAILFLAVDQPRTADLIAAVIRSHREQGALITSPRYRGRGGHPLVFDGSLKVELEAITEEGEGISEVYKRHRAQVNELPMEDPMVRLDLNTPEAYAEAFEAYGAGKTERFRA